LKLGRPVIARNGKGQKREGGLNSGRPHKRVVLEGRVTRRGFRPAIVLGRGWRKCVNVKTEDSGGGGPALVESWKGSKGAGGQGRKKDRV